MKVLLFNIDHPYRSIYTGTIAAALKEKIPSLEITAFLAGPNDLLETTGHFQKIHFFDTSAFFDQCNGLTSAEIEAKMLKTVEPLQGINWDVVINLSANLLGSAFANFVKSKEIRGPSLDQDLNNLKHSDASAFLLANGAEENSAYGHFSYFYRSMLRRFEDVTLKSIWGNHLDKEFLNYFEEQKKRTSKSKIILIDADLAKGNSVSGIEFLVNLYSKVCAHKDFLPILIGPNLKAEHPLIKELQASQKGEVLVVNSQNKAQLSVVGIAALIITDDVYMKAVADVSFRPSILITKELDLNDFSVLDCSMQVIRQQNETDITDRICALIEHGLRQKDLHQAELGKLEVYETKNFGQQPFLSPVSTGGTDDYAKWLLATKFLCFLNNVQLPAVKVSPANYKDAITAEISNIEKRNTKGLYALAAGLSEANIKVGKPIDRSNYLDKLNTFLKQEQSRI